MGDATSLRDRISINPEVLVGKPVIAGTRIPVTLILNLLRHGYSFEQVIEDYPILTEDDIKAALAYAEARLNDEEVQILAEPA